MLSNYVKIAFRNLWKHQGISAINVFGLSVGVAFFLLFLLYGLNEFSFDRFHRKADQLYTVHHHMGEMNGQPAQKTSYLPIPLGPALQADFPDVAHFARLQELGETFVRTLNGVQKEEVSCTDPAFFEMFDFPAVYGQTGPALSTVNNVVLTQAMAQKLFGEPNPTGKVLEIKVEEHFEPFTVAAVVQDVPSNSSVQFGILLPFEKFLTTERGKAGATRWTRFSLQTFAELNPNSTLATDTARMAQFYLKYLPNEEKEARSSGRWGRPERPFSFGFTPLTAVHHDPDLGISARLALILLGIGGIILLIACINFTTLTMGRSAGRSSEIGMRKVLGASRLQLSRQFLTEAVLLSGFSTAAGLGLAVLLLPVFNQLADKHLVFNLQQFPELWWLVPGVAVLTGLLAGGYPALVLSHFSPLETLKSRVKIGGENWFTRSLVVFQFVLSVGLIACTLVMLRQLDFLQSKNPGFNKENVVVVNADGVTNPEHILQRFRQDLANKPEILGVSGSEMLLGADGGWSITGFEYKGQPKNLYVYNIDQHYLDVLGLELLAGRNFDPNVTADTVKSVILNEAAARDFGWTNEQALGQVFTGFYNQEPEKDPVVIGVVRDYNFQSLHEKVEPMMFANWPEAQPVQFFVRIAPGDPARALEHLRTAWSGAEPVLPFRYVFLDENIQRFYEPEAKLSSTVGLAGGVAVLLACLGLLGLAALAAVNRTKEIGIRKVLGASVASVVALLSKDFLKLVVVAILIAAPLAYFLMQRWLADFAYHIDIQWWMLVGAGLAAVAVALVTVGVQSVRTARANPVDSLRNE